VNTCLFFSFLFCSLLFFFFSIFFGVVAFDPGATNRLEACKRSLIADTAAGGPTMDFYCSIENGLAPADPNPSGATCWFLASMQHN
jgi:hypothetical protein